MCIITRQIHYDHDNTSIKKYFVCVYLIWLSLKLARQSIIGKLSSDIHIQA